MPRCCFVNTNGVAKMPYARSDRAGRHERDDAGQFFALHQYRLFVSLLHGRPQSNQQHLTAHTAIEALATAMLWKCEAGFRASP